MAIIKNSIEYEPFGEVVTDYAATGPAPRLGWIGKECDAETGYGNFGVRNYDFEGGRFLSGDVKWEKFRAWSPYNYSGNNTLTVQDRNGKDWFYYQGQGESEKSWHHHDGETATYTDKDGKKQTTSDGYKALVRYTISKNKNGVAIGTLVVLDKDNKEVARSEGVVSGGAQNSDGSVQASADEGTFMLRTDGGNFFKVGQIAVSGSGQLQTVYGLQHFGMGTITTTNGNTYRNAGPWGKGRIRMQQVDQNNLQATTTGDRGLFLHSDHTTRGYTNGCVCEPINNTAVYDYFYNNGVPLNIGKVPFVVEK